MSSTLVPGVVVFCKLRNGTSTLGWYECVVVACPGGAKGDVRVDVVEKLAPQLQDGSNNGPVRQLVSSADGTSFTSCPEAAQAAATALALETAGPRKRRQPSSWADEKKDPQQSRPSAPPEKKQRSRPTAPAQVRARAATLSPWPQQPGPSRPAARPGSTRTLSPTPTLGPQPYHYPWPWQSRKSTASCQQPAPKGSKPAAATSSEVLPQAEDEGPELPRPSGPPDSERGKPVAMTAAEALQQAADEGLELQRASEEATGCCKASGDGSGFLGVLKVQNKGGVVFWARPSIGGRMVPLGRYPTAEQAALRVVQAKRAWSEERQAAEAAKAVKAPAKAAAKAPAKAAAKAAQPRLSLWTDPSEAKAAAQSMAAVAGTGRRATATGLFGVFSKQG